MTGKLLVAIVGLLLIIPNNGNPMLRKDKSNEKETENKEESTKTGTTSTEKPTTVTSKSNDTSQSTTSKSNEQTNETQTKQIAATTTEPGAKQDEELLYFMLPKRQKSNQMANFNLQQQFYFVPKGFQPQLMQPQFMFNQQQMQMPFSYPMMFHLPTNPIYSMDTNYYMGSHLPLGTFDGSNKFFVQQSYRHPFDINIDDRNNKHLTWSISPV